MSMLQPVKVSLLLTFMELLCGESPPSKRPTQPLKVINVVSSVLLCSLCLYILYKTLRWYCQCCSTAESPILNAARTSVSLHPRCAQKIDHPEWIKVREIGQGVFGTVYLALNKRDGSVFAVKESRIQGHPEQYQKLQKEIEMLSHLNHPNIVSYYGAQISSDSISMFLEYVAGGTLKSQVETLGKLPVDLVENYTNQILKGLCFIHENKVIHRDLKPANVLISTGGRLKLADFGTALDLSCSTDAGGIICGTPAFVSPEIARKETHSTATDVWSLGIMIFNMLTGDYPFKNSDHLALLRNIRARELTMVFPSEIPDKFREIIRACLQYEPQDRPTAKELLNDSWNNTLRSSVRVEGFEITTVPAPVPLSEIEDELSHKDTRGTIDSWDFNESMEVKRISRSRG